MTRLTPGQSRIGGQNLSRFKKGALPELEHLVHGFQQRLVMGDDEHAGSIFALS